MQCKPFVLLIKKIGFLELFLDIVPEVSNVANDFFLLNSPFVLSLLLLLLLLLYHIGMDQFPQSYYVINQYTVVFAKQPKNWFS